MNGTRIRVGGFDSYYYLQVNFSKVCYTSNGENSLFYFGLGSNKCAIF